MQWFWTWGGTCFGYRRVDHLFTHNGTCVGTFQGNEVYALDGRYLGEIKNENRLITDLSKRSKRGRSAAAVTGGSYGRYVDYVGHVMDEDMRTFPARTTYTEPRQSSSAARAWEQAAKTRRRPHGAPPLLGREEPRKAPPKRGSSRHTPSRGLN